MAVVYELLQRGGPASWLVGLIVLLGLVSLVVIAERALQLHRAQINVPEFMRGILNILRRRNVVEAISICDQTPGPVARIVRAPLLHVADGEPAMRQAIHNASLSEIPRLERHLKLLLGVAYLAPLLGLLGTVVGLIRLFQTMETQTSTFFNVTQMAGDVWLALLSTACGLVVAIPAMGFYNFFRAHIDDILLDMEKAASEILFYLSQHPLGLDNADARPTRTPEDAAETTAEDGASAESSVNSVGG